MLEVGSLSGEHIRVLLVDDDQGDFVMTENLLSQVGDGTIEIEWVPTYEEAIEALERNEHDLYLIDYLLEDRDGLEIIRAARALGVHKPLIMLTGRGSRGVDLEAMELGAADYLVKGSLDADLLERSIRYALERFRTEEALRESEHRHREFFDNLPVGLHRTKRDGSVVDANPALARILGFPDRDTLQDAYAQSLYVNADDKEHFLELIERDGQVVGFETELERYDGRPFPARVSARAVRDRDDQVLYIEGAVEDLSDRAE